MKKLLVLSVIFLSLVSCESKTDKKLRELKMEIADLEAETERFLENSEYDIKVMQLQGKTSEEQLKKIFGPEGLTEDIKKENAEWMKELLLKK